MKRFVIALLLLAPVAVFADTATGTTVLSSSVSEQLLTWLPLLGMLCSMIVSFIKARKDGKTMSEAVLLIVNTLKDEDKMVQGQFTAETHAKAEAVGNALTVGDTAKNIVTAALSGSTSDVQVGSYKGKPVYIPGGMLSGALGMLKKVIK